MQILNGMLQEEPPQIEAPVEKVTPDESKILTPTKKKRKETAWHKLKKEIEKEQEKKRCKNGRYSWSKEETDTLISLWGVMPVKAIAKKMKRSEGAVKVRACMLGITKQRKKKETTPVDPRDTPVFEDIDKHPWKHPKEFSQRNLEDAPKQKKFMCAECGQEPTEGPHQICETCEKLHDAGIE